MWYLAEVLSARPWVPTPSGAILRPVGRTCINEAVLRLGREDRHGRAWTGWAVSQVRILCRVMFSLRKFVLDISLHPIPQVREARLYPKH
jgi:hypothetical protein